MNIRNATSDQVQVLYDLMREVYQSSGFMSEEFDEKFPSISAFQDFIDQIQKSPGAFVLIAFENGEPAGYISIEPKQASRLKHTAWLNMGVLEKYRNKGIGRNLVDASIEKVKADKIIEIMYLMVRADNVAALNLYRHNGFEILARLENDTKIGNDYFNGILMRKVVYDPSN